MRRVKRTSESSGRCLYEYQSISPLDLSYFFYITKTKWILIISVSYTFDSLESFSPLRNVETKCSKIDNYVRRSKSAKKTGDLTIFFCAFGICTRKCCICNVGKINSLLHLILSKKSCKNNFFLLSDLAQSTNDDKRRRSI